MKDYSKGVESKLVLGLTISIGDKLWTEGNR